jgi:hypothetical protein
MAFPKVQHCIVCEDVRQEVGRKQSILGFYGITPDVTILLRDLDTPIQRLTILFITGRGGGKFSLGCDISDESGNKVIDLLSKEIDFIEQGRRLNLAFAIQMPRFKAGRHQVRLIADGDVVYTTSFEIGKGEPKDFQ